MIDPLQLAEPRMTSVYFSIIQCYIYNLTDWTLVRIWFFSHYFILLSLILTPFRYPPLHLRRKRPQFYRHLLLSKYLSVCRRVYRSHPSHAKYKYLLNMLITKNTLNISRNFFKVNFSTGLPVWRILLLEKVNRGCCCSKTTRQTLSAKLRWADNRYQKPSFKLLCNTNCYNALPQFIL